jgi:hypothetical protein
MPYIDPQSGSIILQIAAAGVLAGMYSIRHFWLRIGSNLRTIWTRLTGR